VAPPNIDLEGAVVAVTGAGRGIGRATAELFAARGATVWLGDLDAASAEQAAATIGRAAHPFELDVRSLESFAQFVEAAGPIDVLINNAGVMPAGPFLAESEATTETIFGVNAAGPLFGMRLVLPGMIERGRGHIVNVASMAGKTEVPGLATYVASKHAVIGLSNAVRAELSGTGVTLTVVLPGIVETDLSSGIPIPAIMRFARVKPVDVARGIVGSCKGRPKEVTVPRWIALYPALRPFIPDPLESLARRLLGDDRALTQVDPQERARYEQRVAKQVME